MFGKTDFLINSIYLISIASSISDVYWRKIFNWITLPAMMMGLIYSFHLFGAQGLVQSFVGIFIGLFLYGWLFYFRVMGGGDVKLLMVFGAWGGAGFALEVAILGVFVGAAMAVIILFFKGKLWKFSKKLYRFVLSLLIRDFVLEIPKIDQKEKLPFGLAVSIAAVWAIHFNPLATWGIG